ncbi:hypothetical protein EJ110_NYTH20765 [Nymphaea thermarum]|nr:hypothetical protein EJ110_NYTH20765 [Nymphaea thermarum]
MDGVLRMHRLAIFLRFDTKVDSGDIYDCMKHDSQPRKRNPSIIRKIQSGEKPSLHGARTTANNSDHESTRNKLRKDGELEKEAAHLEYATASVRGGSYAGAEETLSIWRPTLEHDSEMSISQIWVVSKTGDDFSMSLEAGWMSVRALEFSYALKDTHDAALSLILFTIIVKPTLIFYLGPV